MKWETAKLGDYIDILSGYAFKSRDFVDNGIPVIKIKNITPPNVSLDDLSFVSDETAEKTHKYLLNYNDVLIALTGSHINQMASVVGRVARVKYNQPSLLNQRVGKIIANDNSKCDIDYVYYYLSQDDIKIKLATKAGGAANQANISPSDVKALDIPFPEYDTQKMISSILLSYDALVENNQKQIKLLEEAAQRLYKEWFVDLRFPGHETTPIVDGVPDGWKRKMLIDIADIQYGYAFDGSLFSTDKNGTPIVRIRNIPTGNTNDYTSEVADNQYLVYNGDIVVGMDGEFHINTWCGKTAYLVQRTCRIKPKQENVNGWLLQAIYSPIKYYEKTIVGATVAHLGKKHLDSIELLVGTENLYIPFQNIFEKRQILLNQNNELKEARDRLLPKLMNGEIEV